MLTQALQFLLETAFGLLALALLLRFALQAVRAPSRNPLSAFLMALTDWAVRPARRFIPGLWGLDLSTLVLAWFAELVMLLLVFLLRGGDGSIAALAMLALLAAVAVFKLFVHIVMVATVIQAVLSWVAPYSPAAPLLDALTRPFLRVFRSRIPPVGNVDLSPLFVLVACQLVLMLPVAWLEQVIVRMF